MQRERKGGETAGQQHIDAAPEPGQRTLAVEEFASSEQYRAETQGEETVKPVAGINAVEDEADRGEQDRQSCCNHRPDCREQRILGKPSADLG